MALNIWRKKLSVLFESNSHFTKNEMPKGLEIFCKKPSLANVALQAVKFRSSTGSLSQAIDVVLRSQMKDNGGSSVKYENTYIMGPSQTEKFRPATIESTINDVLNENLADAKYESRKMRELIKSVSDEIKQRIRPLIYHRYKIIVSVTIAPNNGQSMIIVSRSLWDEQADDCCTVQFQNKYMCVVAMVYATWYE